MAVRAAPRQDGMLADATARREPCASPPAAPVAITILDLDRTVTIRGTFSPFLLFAAGRHAPWRLLLTPVVILAMFGYRLRLVDRKRLKETMQRLMLGRRVSTHRLERLADAYAEHTLRRNLHVDMLGLIAREQAEGRLVILTTAAHRYYAEPIARRLGIVEVVATESVRDGESVSHRIDGPNCYGTAKAAAIAAKLVQLGLERRSVRLRCYSDDHSDLPIFLASDEPIVVNPSARLHRHACAHGWPVIDFS